MSNFTDKVFRSLFTDDEWATYEGNQSNYAEDFARFEAMSDTELARTLNYCLSQIRCPDWPKGSPIYDAVIYYNLIPEAIKRLSNDTKNTN